MTNYTEIETCASCLNEALCRLCPAPMVSEPKQEPRWVCELCTITYAVSDMWYPGNYGNLRPVFIAIVNSTRYLEKKLEQIMEDKQ